MWNKLSPWTPAVVFILLISLTNSASWNSLLTRQWEQKKISNSNNSTKIVCYYGLPHKLYNATLPPALNATLCTHVIFINSIITDCQIQPTVKEDIFLFQNAIPIIRKQNPSLKVLLSNGGSKNHEFDQTLLSSENRQRYIDSAVVLLRKYGFDGLDLDWEFPGWNGRPREQRKNFTMVVTGMRAAFEKEAVQTKRDRLMLTIAVSSTNAMMLIYDIKTLGTTVDLVNLMGYDYNGFSDLWPFTGYNSPLFQESYEKEFFTTNNLNWSSHAWVRSGIPKEKLMVGVPVYSHAYTLLIPKEFHGHGAPAYKSGICDSASYVCTCQAIKKYHAVSVFDKAAKVPYAYYQDQWISYDDEQSLTLKAQFVIDNAFGGIMIFSMGADDYMGECDGVTKFPLISTIYRVINGH